MKDKERQLLEILVKYFEQDTIFSSRIERNHPYFKTIVAWGQARPNDIIPWLLNHACENWHWVVALDEIVKANGPPIPEECAGRGDLIVPIWIDWGKANGYL